ncbi:MAG: PASTA domain-containing protein, partial [Firmicutes bacterium]|nr:PASTA domain-containing protein [Bacillota bacterium]
TVSKGESGGGSELFRINVVGMKLDDAIKAITSKGCKYTVNYREDYNSGIDRGCVLSQSPSGQDEVTKGTEYVLTVRSTINEEEQYINLVIDLSDFSTGDHYIAIIVTDNYENKNGVTQWPRETMTKTHGMNSVNYAIHGRGIGTAVVVIDNTTYSYTVNFDEGTFELKN